VNEEKKSKRGRPTGYRAENPHTKRLAVNVTEAQLDAYKAASKRSGETFSAWVRNALDKESNA